MINRIPTRDAESSAAAPAIPSGFRCPLALRFWLFLALLAFWTGTLQAATSAVITFTNFPSTVSNTYNGIITLEINGLTNGVTSVLVQKYLDTDTNRFIDAGDLLVQQFPLTVGQAPVFTNGTTLVTATNFLPCDVSPATNQIITPLNFQNGDFLQNLQGQYLFKISSPSGQFTAVTNLFIVTNAFPSSLVTGAVENVSSSTITNVPNAIVLLFSTQGNSLKVQAGAVANNAGYYSLGAPVGNYFLAAAKSNFVVNLDTQSDFSISAKNPTGVNIGLMAATTNILGRAVNTATNSFGVPGLLGLAEAMASTNGDFLSLYLTDTNGNFVAPAISNLWTAPIDASAAAFAGYLTLESNALLVVSNVAVHVTNSLTPATAIFYGTVSNNSTAAMPGLFLSAVDTAGRQSSALTDAHGNYVLVAVGETNQWQVSFDSSSLTNNYVFSPGYVVTNINAGQAIQENFTLASAPYTISGTVKDVDGNPIAGVVVFATATNISGQAYQAFNAVTDVNGDYLLYVCPSSPGSWTVGISQASLAALGYSNFPANQNVVIFNAGATVNFTLLICGEIQILTTNLPNAAVGSSYDTTLAATSCQNITNWFLANGITLTSLYDQTNLTYPAGTPIYSSTALVGYLFTGFYYGIAQGGNGLWGAVMSNCTASLSYPGGPNINISDITVLAEVSSPLASNATVVLTDPNTLQARAWTATATVASGGFYQTTLTRAGPDSYYSGTRPLIYNIPSGVFMTAISGTTNKVGVLAGAFHSLAVGDSLNLPSTNAYTGTNGATVWLKTGTNNWGEYSISADGPQGGSLPPGLTLYPDGTISGTPTSAGTNGIFNFTVAAEDTSTNATVQPLSITVTSSTTLASPQFTLSSNVFQMQINGVLSGYNYSVLMSTNLASTNWTTIYSTNAVGTNALLIPDTSATNQQRFYRVQIVP
jgi:hypothetical protein